MSLGKGWLSNRTELTGASSFKQPQAPLLMGGFVIVAKLGGALIIMIINN